jgi:hypothetical protein
VLAGMPTSRTIRSSPPPSRRRPGGTASSTTSPCRHPPGPPPGRGDAGPPAPRTSRRCGPGLVRWPGIASAAPAACARASSGWLVRRLGSIGHPTDAVRTGLFLAWGFRRPCPSGAGADSPPERSSRGDTVSSPVPLPTMEEVATTDPGVPRRWFRRPQPLRRRLPGDLRPPRGGDAPSLNARRRVVPRVREHCHRQPVEQGLAPPGIRSGERGLEDHPP